MPDIYIYAHTYIWICEWVLLLYLSGYYHAFYKMNKPNAYERGCVNIWACAYVLLLILFTLLRIFRFLFYSKPVMFI